VTDGSFLENFTLLHRANVCFSEHEYFKVELSEV